MIDRSNLIFQLIFLIQNQNHLFELNKTHNASRRVYVSILVKRFDRLFNFTFGESQSGPHSDQSFNQHAVINGYRITLLINVRHSNV